MKRRKLAGALGRLVPAMGVVALAATAHAKIDLVTLPARDETQLTIYKSEDLTLVRETRSLTLDEGRNEIQFSWANTLIDPTSLQIRVLTDPQDFRVLDASYPANTQNTIVWNIEAAREGTADVEITYFASGLNWRADYSAIASPDETELRIEPAFTIFNGSGEEFANAKTRLVVGEINLTEAIAELARRGIVDNRKAEQLRRSMAQRVVSEQEVFFDSAADMSAFAGAAMPSSAALEEAKEIVKAAVSEYYLYTIEGTETIQDGWGKQLPNPAITSIPIDVSYEYNPRKYGQGVIKFYKFENDEEHELGDTPLPEGYWYVYSGDGEGTLEYQGAAQHKYIPVGEDVELQLGSDGQVILENRVMSEARDEFDFEPDGDVAGYDITREMEIEVRNSRDASVPVKITWPITGDWEITETTDDFRRVDRNTVEWEVDVDGLGKKVIAFTVVERTGSRSRTN